MDSADRKYQSYFEESPVAMFVVNERGEYVDVNPAACEMVGYPREELLNMTIADIASTDIDPESEPTLRELQKGNRVRLHATLVHRDGREVDVLFEGVPLSNGRFIAYCQDITQEKAFEQELQKQRDDLELLNQVLRHDIRNDLQLITLYADQIAESTESESVREDIGIIRDNAHHAVELTKTGREIANVLLGESDEMGPVSLFQVLEQQLTEVQSMYPDAEISTDGSVPEVTVLADEMLGSVFRNLLENSVQHNDAEVPEVTLSCTEHDDQVIVRVADDGPGIPDGQKNIIFGRGEKGLDSQGSGIGLYLVESLVTNYGGAVWVEDNEPTGAVFVVELPKHSTEESAT